MKKKVLFVMESLGIGGAEKSLITILSLLDKEKYDIYLYLFKPDGAFLNQVPSWINTINISNDDKLKKDFKTDWLKYLKKCKFKRSFYSLCWLLGCFISKYIRKENEYIGWKLQKHLYSDIQGKFDVAIGFLEKSTTYFIVDHVTALRKIAFMHTDYDAIPHDEIIDREYYKRIDYLAVVSEHTKETMIKHFPFMEDKVKVIKNMVCPELIYKMSDDRALEIENCIASTKIVTVARLTEAKNIESAINILYELVKRNYDVEWFVIGEGEERNKLENIISKYKLENRFHLLGSKANPYPYMRACDIYVQPSKFEGYGITLAEAKVLCKPIVSSDIPEFREQLINMKTGIYCKNQEEITDTICSLISDKSKQMELSNNLKQCEVSYDELNKLETMF